MLAELGTEAIKMEGVTVTSSMMIIGVGVALVVELVKAALSQWPGFTAEMRKPLLPLVGIGLSMLAFGVAGIENWLLGGIVVGLATGGGYDFIKGVTQKAAKIGSTAPLLAVLLLVSLAGCRAYMQPNLKQQFEQATILSRAWLEDCEGGNNEACVEGLRLCNETMELVVDALNNQASSEEGGDQ
ncbi:MAG: hypothetical protein JXM79_00385 [Sedimentisphaerales bacterium]|nr:hypothetical protein [Sedimentisphaerales bacterium]